VVRCYIQFRKELRTHVYQHDQPSLITLPAPTHQSIAQGQKKNREKTGTKSSCPLDKERAISTTRMSRDEQRATDARLHDRHERAARHRLNPFVKQHGTSDY
jgi:hypothetical protein